MYIATYTCCVENNMFIFSVSLCSGHLLASLLHVEVPKMFSHIASSTFSVGFNTILKYETVTITDIQLHIPVQMSVSL